MIRLIRTKADCCHECNKHGQGVEFELFRDKTNVSFLCWEHFRLNTDILMEAGILWRHPREEPRFTLVDPHDHGAATLARIAGAETRTAARGRSVGSSRGLGFTAGEGRSERISSEGVSESHSRTLSISRGSPRGTSERPGS